jgi:hypothetical protein
MQQSSTMICEQAANHMINILLKVASAQLLHGLCSRLLQWLARTSQSQSTHASL